jgi:glycosyltransferase involved in cell wall biosynthesis
VPDADATIEGLVAIVTPCLNGAAFLRETLESVVAQTYKPIEYTFVDGGSSDDSYAIASSFADRVRVVTMLGYTQAQSVNAVFRESRAEFLAFVNADDLIAPHAIEELVAALQANPAAPYAYADADFIDVHGVRLGSYPTRDFDMQELARACFVCQPATLIRASAFKGAGGLGEQYDAGFDYDLWIRMARSSAHPVRLKRTLAQSRMHYETKTHRNRRRNFREIRTMLRINYGYVPFSWIHAYAGIAVSGKDMFFDPPHGSFARTALTLAIGLIDNRAHPGRFVREYLREVGRLRREKRRQKLR